MRLNVITRFNFILIIVLQNCNNLTCLEVASLGLVLSYNDTKNKILFFIGHLCVILLPLYKRAFEKGKSEAKNVQTPR